MKNFLHVFFIGLVSILTSACSVFGDPGVEIAPYSVLQQDKNIEVRHYEQIVLVSTPMKGGFEEGQRDAFFRLFDYISGGNEKAAKVAMTAPVFVSDASQGEKIAMTAPVFVAENAGEQTMSFVLPATYTYETAPKPKNPDVSLNVIKDYTVATIRFTGFFTEKNIQKNREDLENWIKASGYKTIGPYQSAGYNPPYTIPFLRRNEVLIPVEKIQ